MRILVTGSRDWTDETAVLRALTAYDENPDMPTLVHGGARGLDRIAVRCARWMGWLTEAHPADWARHGRVAGPIRNQQMLDAGADVVVAFPLDSSRGTWDMVRRARQAGVPVHIVEPRAAEVEEALSRDR